MSTSGAARAVEPVYMRVADTLAAKIARRAPGDAVPSENELARSHGVSRLTARAALDELERRFLVRRTKGRGTFVARRIDYNIGPGATPSFTTRVRAAGAEPRVETASLRHRRPSAAIAEKLAVAVDEPVLFLARRRYVDGELAAYAESWIIESMVPGLADVLGVEDSLQDVLRTHYRLDPVGGMQRAEYVIAPADIARHLELEGRPMLLRLNGRTDSRRFDRRIQFTTSWMRADLFRVVFEIEGLR